ncbi:hypothetical protein [Microvirga thermotolerans]|uniref:Uncharacterized protein n=1 Tax=Microvirga thermotolerans TaxID=2651334 RepID=A0A5P9JR79_9HYPH|nr:hypothetical protein [Microvirga thermotolerans]QFU15144.1 hypothetical protein GDR74_02345 [Microvirga thermotolerans]QFU15157.1 hypothetical protein GDR74_02410 [Microvirga thermotolerans]
MSNLPYTYTIKPSRKPKAIHDVILEDHVKYFGEQGSKWAMWRDGRKIVLVFANLEDQRKSEVRSHLSQYIWKRSEQGWL